MKFSFQKIILFSCIFFITSSHVALAAIKLRTATLDGTDYSTGGVLETDKSKLRTDLNKTEEKLTQDAQTPEGKLELAQQFVLNNQPTDDSEKVYLLSKRQYIYAIDVSSSMSSIDNNPPSELPKGYNKTWTLLDSAKQIAQGMFETVQALDKDNSLGILAWSGLGYGGDNLSFKQAEIKTQQQLDDFCNTLEAKGTTPLAEALYKIEEQWLKQCLIDSEGRLLKPQESQPFTVVILTDGQPDNQQAVAKFFTQLVTKYCLFEPARSHLAAFSFVRIGDDDRAKNFLQWLDDDLPKQIEENLRLDPSADVDLIDTKEDNFIFGTGSYKGQRSGILPLLLDAVFD